METPSQRKVPRGVLQKITNIVFGVGERPGLPNSTPVSLTVQNPGTEQNFWEQLPQDSDNRFPEPTLEGLTSRERLEKIMHEISERISETQRIERAQILFGDGSGQGYSRPQPGFWPHQELPDLGDTDKN